MTLLPGIQSIDPVKRALAGIGLSWVTNVGVRVQAGANAADESLKEMNGLGLLTAVLDLPSGEAATIAYAARDGGRMGNLNLLLTPNSFTFPFFQQGATE